MSYEHLTEQERRARLRAMDIEDLANEVLDFLRSNAADYPIGDVHEALVLAAILYLGPAAYYQAMKGMAGTSQVSSGAGAVQVSGTGNRVTSKGARP